MKTSSLALAALAAAVAIVSGCGASHKLQTIRRFPSKAEVALPPSGREAPSVDIGGASAATALEQAVTGDDGRDLILMNAVYDASSGEMVATEELQAARVVARFRNVAERHGEVDLEFLVIVSDSLQDPHWQLRICPTMYVQSDTVKLDSVFITGEDFRRSQERGYRLYGKYLRSLSRDSLHFVDSGQLESLLSRDTFGVTPDEARDHYTRHLLVRYNASRLKSEGRMRRKYLRNPLNPDNVRKDSVASGGQFTYTYVQTVKTRPRLRKADIVLEGGIYDDQKCIYRIPTSDPITFYISSISSFADQSERYKQVVVERAVLESQKCDIAFKAGQSLIDTTLGNNAAELARVRASLADILGRDDRLVLDSVVVRASCSPDGSLALNRRLAAERAAQASIFVRDALEDALDEPAFSVGEDGSITAAPSAPLPAVFCHGIAENWALLDSLVLHDPAMRRQERASYLRLAGIADPDRREARLRAEKYFPYIRTKHYPQLRYVSVEEHMHRKDMVKDTIHTTVVDTLYMRGVKYLEDRDYGKALEILGPYADLNAAVAYLSMDYNASAEKILSGLPRTGRTLYMRAIIASRRGFDKEALRLFREACELEPSYRHRGNLDPEISHLIL